MTSGFDRDRRDVGLGPVAALAAAGASLLLIGALLRSYQARLEGERTRAERGVAEVRSPLPPEPRLQANPRLDLAQLRAKEDQALQGWGWADRRSGLARIPIDRAMDLLAEENKP